MTITIILIAILVTIIAMMIVMIIVILIMIIMIIIILIIVAIIIINSPFQTCDFSFSIKIRRKQKKLNFSWNSRSLIF